MNHIMEEEGHTTYYQHWLCWVGQEKDQPHATSLASLEEVNVYSTGSPGVFDKCARMD